MLILENTYPGQTFPASLDYPYGKARNITVSGDGTGTPWEAQFINDFVGFSAAVMEQSGKTPSGQPDHANASDILDGITSITKYNTNGINNPAFSRQSSSQPFPPDGTPRDYIADEEVVVGWFAGAGGVQNVTYLNNALSFTGGTLYQWVDGVSTEDLVASLATTDGTPVVSNITTVWDAGEGKWKVTITSPVSSIVSSKLESGTVPTKHDRFATEQYYSFSNFDDFNAINAKVDVNTSDIAALDVRMESAESSILSNTNSITTINNSVSVGTSASSIVRRDAAGDIEGSTLTATNADGTTVSGALAFRTSASTNLQFCNSVSAIRAWLGVAPLQSPIFTGTPKAPTRETSSNDTSIATTNFVRNAVAAYAPTQNVSQRATRTTSGTWSITGLTANKPLIIGCDATSSGSAFACTFRVTSGANGVGNTGNAGVVYKFGAHSTGSLQTMPTLTVVPTGGTVTITIPQMDPNLILRAYQ